MYEDAPTHFIAPDAERFAALVQRRSLAGFHLEAMPPLRVYDRYLDTERAALLAAGHTLRLRHQSGDTRVSLRALGSGEGISQRLQGEAENLPDGPVRQRAEALVGPEPFVPILALRQYRLPRGLYDGRQLVGVLSLDVVTDESGKVAESWHEVEVERTGAGAAEDLRRLAEELGERGFAPAARGKFERALFRLGHDDDGLLFLLPDERAALEALHASGSAVERRRAAVLLLAAEGHPTRTISYKAGLSPSRVRHWKHAFRKDRMGVFVPEEPEQAPDRPDEVRAFRVSELVQQHSLSGEALGDVFETVLAVAHRHPGTPRLDA